MKKLLNFLIGKEGDHAAIVWIAIIALAIWSAIGHKPTLEDWARWQDTHRAQYVNEFLTNKGYSQGFKVGDWEKAVPMIVQYTSYIIDTNVGEDWAQDKGSSVKYVVLNAYTLVGLELGYDF